MNEPTGERTSPTPSTKVAARTFDSSRLTELVDGDVALLREIVALFLEDAPGWLDAVRDAGANDDAEALRTSAHALKGALSNFAADRATSLAAELESKGKEGRTDCTVQLVDELHREMDRLSVELEGFCASG